jgi:hypothetical protein
MQWSVNCINIRARVTCIPVAGAQSASYRQIQVAPWDEFQPSSSFSPKCLELGQRFYAKKHQNAHNQHCPMHFAHLVAARSKDKYPRLRAKAAIFRFLAPIPPPKYNKKNSFRSTHNKNSSPTPHPTASKLQPATLAAAGSGANDRHVGTLT